MMVAADAEAQKSIELAKEKAKMAITTQIARWQGKYLRHNLPYILRALQLGGSHGSE
jgi:hypothetical protein